MKVFISYRHADTAHSYGWHDILAGESLNALRRLFRCDNLVVKGMSAEVDRKLINQACAVVANYEKDDQPHQAVMVVGDNAQSEFEIVQDLRHCHDLCLRRNQIDIPLGWADGLHVSIAAARQRDAVATLTQLLRRQLPGYVALIRNFFEEVEGRASDWYRDPWMCSRLVEWPTEYLADSKGRYSDAICHRLCMYNARSFDCELLRSLRRSPNRHPMILKRCITPKSHIRFDTENHSECIVHIPGDVQEVLRPGVAVDAHKVERACSGKSLPYALSFEQNKAENPAFSTWDGGGLDKTQPLQMVIRNHSAARAMEFMMLRGDDEHRREAAALEGGNIMIFRDRLSEFMARMVHSAQADAVKSAGSSGAKWCYDLGILCCDLPALIERVNHGSSSGIHRLACAVLTENVLESALGECGEREPEWAQSSADRDRLLWEFYGDCNRRDSCQTPVQLDSEWHIQNANLGTMEINIARRYGRRCNSRRYVVDKSIRAETEQIALAGVSEPPTTGIPSSQMSPVEMTANSACLSHTAQGWSEIVRLSEPNIGELKRARAAYWNTFRDLASEFYKLSSVTQKFLFHFVYSLDGNIADVDRLFRIMAWLRLAVNHNGLSDYQVIERGFIDLLIVELCFDGMAAREHLCDVSRSTGRTCTVVSLTASEKGPSKRDCYQKNMASKRFFPKRKRVIISELPLVSGIHGCIQLSV